MRAGLPWRRGGRPARVGAGYTRGDLGAMEFAHRSASAIPAPWQLHIGPHERIRRRLRGYSTVTATSFESGETPTALFAATL